LPAVRRVLANAILWAHNPAPSPIVPTDVVDSPTGWFLDQRAQGAAEG
jgi:hypothetical protein